MVGRRKRRSPKLAASPQRSWIWGRHAVLETLAAGRWLPRSIRIADREADQLLPLIEPHQQTHRIDVQQASFDQLTRWCGNAEHQGILAQMPPFPYETGDTVLSRPDSVSLILVLDRIQDPYNFGAILRSAEVFAVDAVVVGSRAQCDVTPHVARASAGAVNRVRLVQVADTTEFLKQVRRLETMQILAATGTGSTAVFNVDLKVPTALVIGNEGSGVAAPILEQCHQQVQIPQYGQIDSLNAAVAAGILMYEVRRQRGGLPATRTGFDPTGENSCDT